jgi:predicted dehydrogenase
MYNTITTVVVGAGFIGPVHVEALKRLGVRVKGVAASSVAESETARKALQLEVGYPDFDSVLADEEVNVVHLAVPNVLHYPMTKQALLAGKHVMCEKPLAMNAEESAELVQLAESTGLVAGVCYNLRFYPLSLEVRQRLSQTEQEVYSIVGSYQQDWLLYDTDYNWRVLADQGGALRAVADIGTHWIDLVSFITGQTVTAVLADLYIVHEERKRPKGEVKSFAGGDGPVERETIKIDTEDCASLLFKFSGGARGQLWVSQVSAGLKNCLRYEIATPDSFYQWNSERPNELSIGHRDRANQLLKKDPSLVSEGVGHFVNYPGGHNEGFPDTFKQCFRDFYDVILGSTSREEAQFANFQAGHHEVVLCEAILQSHREERWIYLNK